jgi:hypothetical protein
MIKPVHLYTGLILAEMYADAIKNSEQQLSIDHFHKLAKEAATFGFQAEMAFDEVEQEYHRKYEEIYGVSIDGFDDDVQQNLL